MDTRALPSTVTLVKEKTVYYLKCHSRGFEKVTWPIVCLAALVIAIVLIAVACGTQSWIQVCGTLQLAASSTTVAHTLQQ